MNDDNLSRRGAIMINRETLHARQMRRAAPKKLRVRHLPARANPRSSPFGLAWRAATEQNRLWKPASGESRLKWTVAQPSSPPSMPFLQEQSGKTLAVLCGTFEAFVDALGRRAQAGHGIGGLERAPRNSPGPAWRATTRRCTRAWFSADRRLKKAILAGRCLTDSFCETRGGRWDDNRAFYGNGR